MQYSIGTELQIQLFWCTVILMQMTNAHIDTCMLCIMRECTGPLSIMRECTGPLSIMRECTGPLSIMRECTGPLSIMRECTGPLSIMRECTRPLSIMRECTGPLSILVSDFLAHPSVWRYRTAHICVSCKIKNVSMTTSSSTVALSVDNGAWLTVLDSGSSCSGRVSVRFLEDRVTSCQY